MTTPHVLFDYVGHLPECPTWSEDESALYWTDILEQEIHRYHPASGTHSVLAFPEEVGCFALREQGGFIVAMRHAIWLADKNGLLQRKVCDNPSNTKLARFSPQGEQLEEYRLPVRCPTMVCFGGADMKTLFITTTRENMSAQEVADYPLSGAIFTLQVAVAGMKKSRFIERQAGSTGTTFSLG
ncbi:SMP-30/gluconolactonase/LRE family protein [Salmonella enterica subsp. enterica serovar Panama]|uniref:SMP-30/gluconolactonase/LRE family protein n=1 Tax=Salmonella enterica TaxID=28901 RepID=UPI001D6337E8|nr:hypothetical protein [Salmonella enterica subsp. enterica serovar Anatum]